MFFALFFFFYQIRVLFSRLKYMLWSAKSTPHGHLFIRSSNMKKKAEVYVTIIPLAKWETHHNNCIIPSLKICIKVLLWGKCINSLDGKWIARVHLTSIWKLKYVHEKWEGSSLWLVLPDRCSTVILLDQAGFTNSLILGNITAEPKFIHNHMKSIKSDRR